MMADSPCRAVYIVRLRPEAGMTEDDATRSLRAFLKAALRSYGLRCLSAEPEPTSEGEVVQ